MWHSIVLESTITYRVTNNCHACEYSNSVFDFCFSGFWLPDPTPPIIKEVAYLKLNTRLKTSAQDTRLNFTISGNVLLSFLVRPRPNVVLTKWNLLDEIPEPNVFNEQKSYFVMITHGINGSVMDVILDLQASHENYDGPLVDITVVTTHWEYHKEFTPTFNGLLARVPKWAFAVPSVASLESRTY